MESRPHRSFSSSTKDNLITHASADNNLSIVMGDIFDFFDQSGDDKPEACFDVVYDRASFMALPKELRERYVRGTIASMKPNSLYFLEVRFLISFLTLMSHSKPQCVHHLWNCLFFCGYLPIFVCIIPNVVFVELRRTLEIG